MFANLLYQNASSLLAADISRGNFPPAVMFAGPSCSGKLSCALETARVLGCAGETKGLWNCQCSSCLQHKQLVNNNLIIAGPRNCSLEICAAAKSFLDGVKHNASYLVAVRYLFLRSIRKLTSRFNPVLWQDDRNVGSIANLVGEIDEQMEIIDFPRPLPEFEILQKTVNKLVVLSEELENKYLYVSIPISQIRNLSSWAKMKSVEGSKTVIIENADRMSESVRNALLKILEEPPADTVFILTTTKKNAVMQTILSRVRVYNFVERNYKEQQDVLSRIFHESAFNGNVSDYLMTFLPVKNDVLLLEAKGFLKTIANGKIPDVSSILKECNNFEPKMTFWMFLKDLEESQRKLLLDPCGAKASFETVEALKKCWIDVTSYNQKPQAALENLVRIFSKINKTNGNVFRCVDI